MRNSFVLCLIVASVAFAPLTGADLVIPIAGSGQATGSGFMSPANLFNAQPATPPSVGTTTNNFGTAPSLYTTEINGQVRKFYIDFGVDYADYIIQDVYLGLMQFGTAATVGGTNFWSSTIGASYDPGDGDVIEPDLNNFFVHNATTDKQWVRPLTGLSVTPEHRYLIVDMYSGSQGNRIQEMVLVGTLVPEPGTLTLLALAGIIFGGLRRGAVKRRS